MLVITALALAVVAICATIVVVVLNRESSVVAAASAPSPTPTPTSPSLPSGQVMDVSPQADIRYLSALSDAGLVGPADDEEQAIEVGRLVCAYLATGQGDLVDAAVVVHESGQATKTEAGPIVRAAVDAYCRQYDEGS